MSEKPLSEKIRNMNNTLLRNLDSSFNKKRLYDLLPEIEALEAENRQLREDCLELQEMKDYMGVGYLIFKKALEKLIEEEASG